MNLRLPHILLIALVFCTGTKSHAQREIHPLEPMFTYDYALKYYGNLPMATIIPYPYYLENFTAPLGIESIEVFYTNSIRNINAHFSPVPLDGGKEIYLYNSETGYLKESYKIKKDTVSKSLYNYKIDNINTIIKISSTYYLGSRNDSPNTVLQFIIENKSGNLEEIQYESSVYQKFEYRFVYDEMKKYVSQVIFNTYRQNKISDTQIYEIENFLNLDLEKRDYVLFNDKKIPLNNERKAADIFTKKQKTDTENVVQFSENHISYHWKINDFPKERMGLFLFNKNKELLETHYYDTEHEGVTRAAIEIEGKKAKKTVHSKHNIIKKKNKKKWTTTSYITRNKIKTGYTKHKKRNQYKIKDNIIYFDNKPFIIYNYE